MIRTYRYRAYPTRFQAEALTAQLGWACDLYNAALQERRDAWRMAGRSITKASQGRELTEFRRENPDGYPDGMAALVQHEVLARVDRSFAAFFRRCKQGGAPGYPRFKMRRRYDSLTFGLTHGTTGGAGEARNGHLRLTGIGRLKLRWHRPIPAGGVVRSCVIRRSCGRWYACLVLELPDIVSPVHRPDGEVGVDMGVVQWATLSTGEMIDGPRAGRRAARVVRLRQRRVAKRTKLGRAHTRRRQKAVLLYARAEEYERNMRKDHRHKVARDLALRFGTIYVERLGQREMTRAAGDGQDSTLPRPLKRNLNREILDQAWYEFQTTVTYKAEEAGGSVVLVSPEYTTQVCSECGELVPKPPSSRVHECPYCGYAAPRTVNSARNVLQRGLEQTGRAGPSGANGRGSPHAVA